MSLFHWNELNCFSALSLFTSFAYLVNYLFSFVPPVSRQSLGITSVVSMQLLRKIIYHMRQFHPIPCNNTEYHIIQGNMTIYQTTFFILLTADNQMRMSRCRYWLTFCLFAGLFSYFFVRWFFCWFFWKQMTRWALPQPCQQIQLLRVGTS